MSKPHHPMDPKSLKEEYEEIQLKLALSSYLEQEGRAFRKENEELRDNPLYQPTEEEMKRFQLRLQRRIWGYRVLGWMGMLRIKPRKAALALPLLLVLLTVSAVSVEAVRVRMYAFFVQMKESYTEFRLEQQTAEPQTASLQSLAGTDAYVPTEVPTGYRMVRVTHYQTMKEIEYTRDDGGSLLFQQKLGTSGVHVDSEDADDVAAILVQGEKGMFVRKGEKLTVVWQKRDQLFLLMGEETGLSEEEFVQLAESVEKIE
ncbi:DUF4367 domain-containing protein [Gorillibacterium sp. CAU 1737]|uniref:DUF4367 domain-containing protein n=1 Tax=Gorillibacterium sp. CAU 1737 TaxID=3140362 RepID=UPI0032616417